TAYSGHTTPSPERTASSSLPDRTSCQFQEHKLSPARSRRQIRRIRMRLTIRYTVREDFTKSGRFFSGIISPCPEDVWGCSCMSGTRNGITPYSDLHQMHSGRMWDYGIIEL